MTPFAQKTRKVSAAYQPPRSGISISPFQAAVDAGFIELRGDIVRTFRAAAANGRQTLDQRGILRVYTETNNVQRLAAPTDGDLHPIDESDVLLVSSTARFLQPAHIIVVGQCQHIHSARGGMLHQLCGRQQTVGNRGMAVQVNVEHEADGSREARDAS